jgi:hypothetical protein
MPKYTLAEQRQVESRLSPHFTFRELTKTSHRHYQEDNIRGGLNNYKKLQAVATDLLEPVRVHYHLPLIVTSGYRYPALNSAIGGSKKSQHMKAEAADFHVNGADLTKVWKWIAYDSDVMFGQIILEGWAANRPTWIHISLGDPYRTSWKCGQILTWNKKDGYRYVGRKTGPGEVTKV